MGPAPPLCPDSVVSFPILSVGTMMPMSHLGILRAFVHLQRLYYLGFPYAWCFPTFSPASKFKRSSPFISPLKYALYLLFDI